MTRVDLHTHTTFSSDGKSTLEEMVQAAYEGGVSVYGVSEHINFDYDRLGLTIYGQPVPPTDVKTYFSRIRSLQKQYAGKLRLLAGMEYGYDHSTRSQEKYAYLTQTYRPDFIVNSIHTCLGDECYFPPFFEGKSKEYAYNCYLYRVLESLDAPYEYDVVAHLGYCARNATYPDAKLRYEEFSDVLDLILKRIIQKDKILEINTSSKTAGSPFIPDVDILRRYFDLGGRKVSFASDAHNTARICEKYDLVCNALKTIGFTHFTLPYRSKHERIDL